MKRPIPKPSGALLSRALLLLLRGDWRYVWRQLRILWRSRATSAPRPVPLEDALDLLCPAPPEPHPSPEPVTIVLPVHNGFEHLPRLFDSLQRNTPEPHHLVVVDDASTDPRVQPLLRSATARHADAVVLRNDSNLGFAATVNRAAERARGHLVLLNSDVELPPGWLPRLLAPLLRDPTVATATPMSNAATILSFPARDRDNAPWGGLSVDRIDRWFARVHAGPPWVEIPTGIGFCMAVRADAWKRVGPFDESTFRAGYGEENDWCLRAASRGYRNVAVPNLFVLHHHGASFADRPRQSLRRHALRAVTRRHPDYPERLADHARRDPLRAVRALLAALIAAAESPHPPLLVVDHSFGGGANHYRDRLLETERAAGRPVFLLAARPPGTAGSDLSLEFTWAGHGDCFAVTDPATVTRLFRASGRLGEIFLNGATGFPRPLTLLACLAELRQATRARLTVALHDYYPVCPSYNLLDDTDTYCDIPALARCRACLPRNPHARNPENASIEAWRGAWEGFLCSTDRVLCFSEDTRQRFLRAHPATRGKIELRPHHLPVPRARTPRLPSRSRRLHVAAVGTIGVAKGAHVLAELARHLRHTDPTARVTVIGSLAPYPRLRNLRATGPYQRDELPDLLERFGINVCLIPSVCPETYCLVADELMAMDVPVVCFDIGAHAERVRRYPHGYVVPLGAPIEDLARVLRQAMADEAGRSG